jgi:D-erythronate 2-dehydrogenase
MSIGQLAPVIITGAGGFVGRELVRLLLDQGAYVVALDNALLKISAPMLRSITGDIAAPETCTEAFKDGCHALVHLATVPGGAAEADPAASRRINIDAMYDLLDAAKASGNNPRVVYASSIAVFGGHKAMMETAVAMMSHRGEIDGVTVRLPGILARPKGPSGMKSAFMSDLFHALRARDPVVCPVSDGATIWAQSVTACAANLAHALTLDSVLMPVTRAVTLPAQRITMGNLAAEIARQTGASTDLVTYDPSPSLEAAFGSHPPLATPAAEHAGFAHDRDLATLVSRALAVIARDEGER